eukprot:TRINITY_DN3837_c0_g1_i1.p1 TRINITY_DN3837_c0_g1~~TRINITY_DN3837_c0_g1_i1.p1  ORF type:complete len:88 (+),score=2.74 TRINITY_DN3837_c0_g1_i1:81-344(+)
MNTVLQCPPSASFFGMMGCTCALVFANLGAAYGTAKSGVGVASMGVMRPELVMRNIIRGHGWCARYLRSHRSVVISPTSRPPLMVTS